QTSEIEFITEIAEIDNLFPKELEIHIFRIIQESINNIVKHSQATNALIQVKKLSNQLIIIIYDNGKGFEFSHSNLENLPTEGLGLRGIFERVKILQGKLTINTGRKSGVEIKIELPIQEKYHGKDH
ncbi:MAG: hypothetical protein GXO74_16120, partial [Calditrichaeota bacterium]|nr:hypothetical protein [Calditrichota bacterium]